MKILLGFERPTAFVEFLEVLKLNLLSWLGEPRPGYGLMLKIDPHAPGRPPTL
jgi:hypothetical protein